MSLQDHPAARAWKFLIRDCDVKFNAAFTTIGIRIILTPIRAPRANAIAEQWIGSFRECLDRILIVTGRHLVRVLTESLEHYNHHRPITAHTARWINDHPTGEQIRHPLPILRTAAASSDATASAG
ncbi:integrase core domain-containing protein [Streptosporangiaceae bacterium NEAU-GS5]|nr:integrase core domain-containing protein [Streptosporangiaceae bacterium NEAU-GS5]